jgi:hypothetical protein
MTFAMASGLIAIAALLAVIVWIKVREAIEGGPMNTYQEPLGFIHSDPLRSGAATRKDAGRAAPAAEEGAAVPEQPTATSSAINHEHQIDDSRTLGGVLRGLGYSYRPSHARVCGRAVAGGTGDVCLKSRPVGPQISRLAAPIQIPAQTPSARHSSPRECVVPGGRYGARHFKLEPRPEVPLSAAWRGQSVERWTQRSTLLRRSQSRSQPRRQAQAELSPTVHSSSVSFEANRPRRNEHEVHHARAFGAPDDR